MAAREISRRRWFRSVGAVAALVGLGFGSAASSQQPLLSRLLRFSAVIDGTAETALRWPVDVAAGPQDEVAAADAWKNRLVVFHRVGAGWSMTRVVELPSPPAAVTYAAGRYLVAVRGSAKLFSVASGESGAAPEEIALPESIVPGRLAVASDGALLVADRRLGRVVKLREGAVIAQVAIDKTVTALSSDGAGGFWVAIGEAGELRRFDGGGQRVATWRLPSDGPIPAWPSGIATEPSGRLFVLDRHTHRVLVLDANGGTLGVGSGKGWEPGQLFFPGGLVRLPSGVLLVGDGGNGRAQLFDVVGPGAG